MAITRTLDGNAPASALDGTEASALIQNGADVTYSMQQVRQLIAARYLDITDNTVLTNPCPQTLYINMGAPGKSIQLPPANAVNGQPAGAWIDFIIAPSNAYNFDILTADGDLYDTVVGTLGTYNAFSLSYSTNANLNGTPVRRLSYFNANNLGSAAFEPAGAFCQTANNLSDVNQIIARQNISVPGTSVSPGNPNGIRPGEFGDFCIDTVNGNLMYLCTTPGDASTAVWTLFYLPSSGGVLTGNLSIERNVNSPAQFGVYNQDIGTNARAEIYALTEGADAIYVAAINGGNLWTRGLRASTGDYVISNTNSLASGQTLNISQDGAITFPLTPAASAYINATQSNLTGDGTYVDITGGFFTELRDDGGDFLNGTMTGRKSGMYKSTAQFIINGVQPDHTFGDLNIVTSLGTFTLNQINPAAVRTIPGVVNTVCLFGNATFPMIAGDTAKWQFSVSGTNKTVNIVGGAYSLFSFELIA